MFALSVFMLLIVFFPASVFICAQVIGIVTRKDLARYKFFQHNGHCGVVELGMATN